MRRHCLPSYIMTRYPIASLPLPPVKDRLIASLTPDPVPDPSVASFQRGTLQVCPSIQRRSRILDTSAHYSFTTPFPVPFPYSIPAPPNPDDRDSVVRNIESWLTEKEPLTELPSALNADSRVDVIQKSGLRKYAATRNDFAKTRLLLGLSQSCIDDLLPALDVGDAFAILGKPALDPSEVSSPPDEDTQHTQATLAPQASQELIDVLSGYSALMTPLPDSEGYSPNDPSYAPWSLRYSGHQFGIWAGPLGDGRAVSIRARSRPSFCCGNAHVMGLILLACS